MFITDLLFLNLCKYWEFNLPSIRIFTNVQQTLVKTIAKTKLASYDMST